MGSPGKYFITLLILVCWCSHTAIAQDFSNAAAKTFFTDSRFPFADTVYNKTELTVSADDFGYASGKCMITRLYFVFKPEDTTRLKGITIKMGQEPYVPSDKYYSQNLTPVLGPLDTSFADEGRAYTGFTLNKPFFWDPANVLIISIQDAGSPHTAQMTCTSGNFLPRYRLYGKSNDTLGAVYDALMPQMGIDVKYLENNNLSVTDLTNKNFCPSATKYGDCVMFNIQNRGINNIDSFYTCFEADGVRQKPVLQREGIGPGITKKYCAGTVFFAPHTTHTLKVWAYLPNNAQDSIRGDDTLMLRGIGPDSIPPTIELLGLGSLSFSIPNRGQQLSFPEPGYILKDNITPAQNLKVKLEGTLPEAFPGLKNLNKPGRYTLVYHVSDYCGNSCFANRVITIADNSAPEVLLKGAAIETVCRWADYTDPGYEVTDNYDTTADIRAEAFGTWFDQKSSKPGLYFIRYKAVDKSGNAGYSAKRTILVLDEGAAGCDSVFNNQALAGNTLTIYPSPSETGNFTVSALLPLPLNTFFSITDIYGRPVNSAIIHRLTAQSATISLPAAASGVYIITMIYGKDVVNKKVVVGR